MADEKGCRFDVPRGVPANAACLIGHFPGRPIVPGAVLLGYAAHHIETEGFKISNIKRIKFFRPLLPDQPFTIDTTPLKDRTTVTWSTGDTILARATVILHSDGR